MLIDAARISLLFTLCLVASGCGGSSVPTGTPDGEVATASAQRWLNHDAAVGYVGIDECRQCHLDVWATYSRTGMGGSFSRMEPEAAVADWSGENELVFEPTGVRYRMAERDGRFYMRQYVLDETGRETAVVERELEYYVGSNHHNRTYLVVEDGSLFQAPVCWYPGASRWAMCPGFELKNDGFARETSDSCVFCHNGVMRLVEGERNRFEEPYPHGIGCERCHGPGELHATRWSSGNDTPGGAPDDTIVHPRRLGPDERMAVCAQCHLGDARATERVARHGRDAREFRPGQPLEDSIVAFRYVQPTEYDFGLSAQVDRFVLSPCYLESEGRFDCLTCHNPHISVYDENHPPDEFRRRCLSCHDVQTCTADPATREVTDPVDDCVACHMRKAEPDDLRYAEFTDHWIRRDIRVEERDHRENFDIEPTFPDAFAKLPQREQAYYRARANFLLASDAPGRHRPILWERAETGFVEAIELGFDEADSWFFLGKVRLLLGRPRQAQAAFREAVARAPEHHDANFALGQTLAGLGDLPAAAEVFIGMLQRDGDNAMALAELGRASFGLQRGDIALDAFGRAVAAEPWNASLRVNLGRVLAAAGHMEEAASQAEEAVRRDPDSSAAWQFYAEAMAALGRKDQARAGSFQVERLSGSGY